MAKEMVAEVGEHPFAGPAGVVGLYVAEEHAEDADEDEGDHEVDEQRGAAVAHLVDGATDEVGRREADRGCAEQRDERDRRASLVRPCERIQRAQPAACLAPRPVLDARAAALHQMAARLVDLHATSSVKMRSSIPCS